jgi:phospholipase D1/2
LQDEKHAHSHTTENHTLGSYISRVFHLGHENSANNEGRGQASQEISHQVDSNSSSGSSASSSVVSVASAAPAPMLDPSTNANPLEPAKDNNSESSQHEPAIKDKKRKRKHDTDVSKHTFYIENSQMRLKLFARNEVS